MTLGEDNPSKDHIDFGYVPDYSIHGLVYRDGDRSESHGTDEKGYANQTVELRDKDGKVVAVDGAGDRVVRDVAEVDVTLGWGCSRRG